MKCRVNRRRDVEKSGKKEKINITFTTTFLKLIYLPAREIELGGLDNLWPMPLVCLGRGE